MVSAALADLQLLPLLIERGNASADTLKISQQFQKYFEQYRYYFYRHSCNFISLIRCLTRFSFDAV